MTSIFLSRATRPPSLPSSRSSKSASRFIYTSLLRHHRRKPEGRSQGPRGCHRQSFEPALLRDFTGFTGDGQIAYRYKANALGVCAPRLKEQKTLARGDQKHHIFQHRMVRSFVALRASTVAPGGTWCGFSVIRTYYRFSSWDASCAASELPEVH